MSTPLDVYQDQARFLSSDIPWVAALQSQALDNFTQSGLPTRKNEDWKYTILDSLWKESFQVEKEIQHSHTSDVLPEGVIVLPLHEAFISHADKIKAALSQSKNGFHALNTACLHHGFFIYVPEGVQVENPVTLNHYRQGKEARHIRNLIIAEANSALTVVEDYTGEDDHAYLTNTVTDLVLQEHARVTHYKIQRESHAAFHIGLITVKQAQNSHFENHSFSLGGKLVRSDMNIEFLGSRASCLMNGVYIPGEGQHIDHHTEVHHAVPDCSSTQDYKGILMGRSRAVFNGKVIVAKNAQHTDASQQNKNLLLSKGSEIDTKPQLEIFADDVICTHGATVGQLDEDALFYLATRGIDREEASAFLVHAFVSKNLQLIPHEAMAERIENLINQQLELQA